MRLKGYANVARSQAWVGDKCSWGLCVAVMVYKSVLNHKAKAAVHAIVSIRRTGNGLPRKLYFNKFHIKNNQLFCLA